jgi:mono/diheme cytochrome c family protein
MITPSKLIVPLVTTSLALVLAAGFLQASQGQKSRKPPTKKPPASAPAGPSAETVALGKKVYDKNGCATCHSIAGKGGMAGPDLSHTGDPANHTAAWLSTQVANPKSHTPDSTMPPFAASIKGQELTAIGAYLSTLKTPAAPSTGGSKTGVVPNAAAVEKITKLGGSVGQVAQNDDHLEVSFHLVGAAINDTALTSLTSLKNVVRLDLGNTSITDAGLVQVKALKGLTELHLENTKITDAGLANLADLRDLTYLNLYGTNVTDAGLEHLTKLTKLTKLYLWQTKVTQEGADKLKKALPQIEINRGWDITPKKP